MLSVRKNDVLPALRFVRSFLVIEKAQKLCFGALVVAHDVLHIDLLLQGRAEGANGGSDILTVLPFEQEPDAADDFEHFGGRNAELFSDRLGSDSVKLSQGEHGRIPHLENIGRTSHRTRVASRFMNWHGGTSRRSISRPEFVGGLEYHRVYDLGKRFFAFVLLLGLVRHHVNGRIADLETFLDCSGRNAEPLHERKGDSPLCPRLFSCTPLATGDLFNRCIRQTAYCHDDERYHFLRLLCVHCYLSFCCFCLCCCNIRCFCQSGKLHDSLYQSQHRRCESYDLWRQRVRMLVWCCASFGFRRSQGLCPWHWRNRTSRFQPWRCGLSWTI